MTICGRSVTRSTQWLLGHSIILTAICCSGCGTGSGDVARPRAAPSVTVPARTDPLLPPPAEPTCSGARVEPITVAAAEAELRSTGFSVRANLYSDLCSARDIAHELSNIVFEGPHANVKHHAEIVESEGNLACALRVHPLRQGMHESWSLMTGQISMDIDNLECSLVPSRVDPTSSIARLRNALEALRG